MIGITLSSEQIRNAPADVRRWIEREVMMSVGPQAAPENGSKSHGEHLAACSEQDVAAILSQIQGVLPAVNVFFEFGRQGAVFGQPDVEAFRLLDIAHHARLQNVGQVIACLDVISQAFSRVGDDAEATFCGFDREGHCFITRITQQNILKLWRKVIAGQQLTAEPAPLLGEETSGAPSPTGEASSPNQGMNGTEPVAGL
ncbi:hypothetical protein [Bradyrhizobium sp. CCBAU 051011]|uniref:hypothetical protein n=1 Tax=Bradyrhizobium sp. CCBAU 051011 TaxID=858422 RepID=UPI001FEE18D6|nr:hypothetical protein [Bradyrhizobium sp. CCBAU 051011]